MQSFEMINVHVTLYSNYSHPVNDSEVNLSEVNDYEMQIINIILQNATR